MPLVRWAAVNRGAKKVSVKLSLHDMIGQDVGYPGPKDNVPETADVDPAGTPYGDFLVKDPAGATWMGSKVQVHIKSSTAAPGAYVPVLPWPLPRESMDPDYIFEVRVEVDVGADADHPLVTIWGLDGLGYWWLLCDRTVVTLT